MITMLFTGCGSSSSSASSGSATEVEKTETTEALVQEEKNSEAAPDMEKAGTANASVQDEEKSAVSTGFRYLSHTVYDAEGRLQIKRIFYEGFSPSCWIINTSETDADNYAINIYDREYDEEGKWIGTKIYSVNDITDIEDINLDDYKIEDNLVGTGVCKYDDNGILTDGEKIEDGEVIETYTFWLDEYGNILRWSVFDKDGNLTKIVEKGIVPVYE